MEPQLPLAHYRLTFTGAPAGDYAGSAWRGAFGRALRETLCVTRAPACEGCALLATCGYPYLFETAPPPASQALGKLPAVPHPYVLEPAPPAAATDREHRLDLILFGRGNQYLPYGLLALERAAGRGIGPGRPPLRLAEVRQESRPGGDDWAVIYRPREELAARPAMEPVAAPSAPSLCRVRLRAPLRLLRAGRPLRPGAFTARDFLLALVRRISWLAYFHAGGPHRPADLDDLVAAAGAVRIVARGLRWWDWARYSSRQHQRIPMGGAAGWLELAGPGLARLWPYLWLGQWTHVGRGAVMGLGGYRLLASLPNAASTPPSASMELEPVLP